MPPLLDGLKAFMSPLSDRLKSASPIQKEIALLRRQAAKVFSREAFKYAVWVGVFGEFSEVLHGAEIDVVIFYDPKYSQKQILGWYSSCEKNSLLEDPDEPKLLRVWGRKANIQRIYGGALDTLEKVEAVLSAWTVYGNPVDRTLDELCSSYVQKMKECYEKLSVCKSLADLAKESEDSSKVCKKVLSSTKFANASSF
jgi:hypothetical protein